MQKQKMIIMKKMTLMAAFLFTAALVLASNGAVKKVEFFTGSIISAKEKAKAESKYYFLEFYAEWCKPCKWMDENTFTNRKLVDYVEDNYVPVKVNIEDFDGHALKQKYNVEYLPTIIVFSENGQLLGKYEKSLSASQMLKILKDHRSAATVKPNRTSNAKSHKPISEVATPRTTHSASPAHSGMVYRIQVGVYKDATNVFSQVEKLKPKFSQSVTVINEKNVKTGEVMYRIVVGKFYSRHAADAYMPTVKNAGIDGFVKTFPAE